MKKLKENYESVNKPTTSITILASASLSLLVKLMFRLGMALRIATRDWMVFEYTTGLENYL